MNDPAIDNQDELPTPIDDVLDADSYRIKRPGGDLWLIGTAHVSQKSVEDVRALIAEVKPDVVCLELDEARYEALTDPSRWRKLDIFQVIRQGKTLMLLANLAIGAYQRRIGKELGVMPGAELLAGHEMAQQVGARVELVDRNIQTTLRRVWARIPWWRKMAVLGAIMESLISREEISAQDIENLKKEGHLGDMMSEFARVLPEVTEPLIDERDRYMASRIDEVQGERVVAVVGAAHVPGMKGYFGKPIDREALDQQPQRSKVVGALKWVIPVLILGAFAFGWQKGQAQTVEQMIWAWIVPNSVAAGLLTALAGGKPLSVITSLFSSPISSLNPLLGTAMIVGPVEAWLRKPTVEDCERINDDVQSLKGIYTNPFTRVLLVSVMANLGSALGAWIGATWVVSVLTSAS